MKIYRETFFVLAGGRKYADEPGWSDGLGFGGRAAGRSRQEEVKKFEIFAGFFKKCFSFFVFQNKFMSGKIALL